MVKRPDGTPYALLSSEGGNVLLGVAPDGKLVGRAVADITPRDIAAVPGRFDPPTRV